MAVYTVTFSWSDEANRVGKTAIHFPSTMTAENVGKAAIWYAGVMDALTNGGLRDVSMTVPIAWQGYGIPTVALDGSRISEGAMFTFETASGYKTRVRIPARTEAIIKDGTSDVDQASGAIIAFKNVMITGLDLTSIAPVPLGTGFATPCDIHGDDIVVLRKAVEHFIR